MVHKKRSEKQKYFAVIMAFSSATYQRTAHDIAKEMGYVNGTPLRGAVQQLVNEGLLEETEGQFFGLPATWYWMPRASRVVALEKIGFEYPA